MKSIQATLVAVALLAVSQAAWAGDCCCPSCGEKVCRVEANTESVKKSCYKVECKEICIPKIKFCWPWQQALRSRFGNGCGNGCGDAGCDGSCDARGAAITCTDGCANGSCNSCDSCRGAARCGKVKTVRVLKKVDYECKKCGHEWKIYDVGCASGGCGDGCTSPHHGPAEAPEADQPGEAPQPPATARIQSDRPVNTRTVAFPR